MLLTSREPVNSSMRIYKVQVRGHFKETHEGEVKSALLVFLIEANSVDEAFVAGPSVAETVAYVGPKWVSFESAEASAIEFPFMLSDTTGTALRR